MKNVILRKQARQQPDEYQGQQIGADVREEAWPRDSTITIAPKDAGADGRHDKAEPIERHEAERHPESEAILQAGGDDKDGREGGEERQAKLSRVHLWHHWLRLFHFALHFFRRQVAHAERAHVQLAHRRAARIPKRADYCRDHGACKGKEDNGGHEDELLK